MFERYTERARRVLFFARYEASQLGSLSIDTEHFLLGLIRESKGLTSRIFAQSQVSLESIRKEIEGRTVFREKSLDIDRDSLHSREPSASCSSRPKRPIGLIHNYIGTEHLLLGILREESGLAARVLIEKGLRINIVRDDIVRLLNEREAPPAASELTRCCFCGEPLLPDDGAALVVYPRPGSEGSQTLYTHRQCLRTRVPPGVPLITD